MILSSWFGLLCLFGLCESRWANGQWVSIFPSKWLANEQQAGDKLGVEHQPVIINWRFGWCQSRVAPWCLSLWKNQEIMKNIIQFYSLSVLNFWWSKMIDWGGNWRGNIQKNMFCCSEEVPERDVETNCFLSSWWWIWNEKWHLSWGTERFPQKQPLAQRFNTRRCAFCG